MKLHLRDSIFFCHVMYIPGFDIVQQSDIFGLIYCLCFTATYMRVTLNTAKLCAVVVGNLSAPIMHCKQAIVKM